MVDLAKVKNNTPLPQVKSNFGLRLPPDRYLLNKSNLKVQSPKKNVEKTKESEDLNRMSLSNNLVIKRPATLSNVTRPQIVLVPKPVFKVDFSKYILSIKSLENYFFNKIILSDTNTIWNTLM